MSHYQSGDYYQPNSHFMPYATPPPNFMTPFSVPPPPLPPSFNVPPPVSQSELSQQEQDQAWINEWIKKLGITQNDRVIKKTSKPFTIREARQLVSDADNYLQELEAMQKNLEEKLECDELTWNTMTSMINAKKDQLAVVTKKITDPDFVSTLRRMLSRRAAKRNAQKRRKSERQREWQLQMANRQAQHLQIDEWLLKEQDVLERKKREADTKSEADSVLGEVRSKQSEGRRTVQLLTSLKKLRHVRAQAAADKGLRPSVHEDARFEKVVEKLSLMWGSQLENYDIEERTLKVMLEEEAVARHGHHQKMTKKVDPLKEWEQLLFGPAPSDNNMEYALLNRANTDLQELVQTRKKWDEMVVGPDTLLSSAPPIGWVIPVAPSSEEWRNLLKKC